MDDRFPKNTKYHSGFISGLKMLLWPYLEKVSIEEEKCIGKEGLRIDAVVYKADPSMEIGYDLCRIFRKYNVVEYKRPDDNLNIRTVAKAAMYANGLVALCDLAEPIRFDEISVTIYRHAYPRETIKELIRLGATVERKYPGIYYVEGKSFYPTQIIVGRELDDKEYAMFRVLVPDASENDIKYFKDMAVGNKDARYQKYVDNIFQVSVPINKETYIRLMKEDPEMCDALRDLMKDEFIETEKRGEARGAIKEAIKIYHDEMHLMPSEIVDKIMIRFTLEKDEAERYVEEVFELAMV